MHAPTWIDLAGAVNVRDLGGLPTKDGRQTAHGVLIRSDGVHELTEDDVATVVDGLGVRHIVDLRSAGERAEQGRGILARSGVRYSELDVLTDEMIARRREERFSNSASIAGEPSEIIAQGYREFLAHGKAAFVTALQRLATPGGCPAIIHCAAGKDRTGVLVALLLDVAGVCHDTIVADYAATAVRMDAVRARLAQMPFYAELAKNATPMLLDAPAATMDQFLCELHRAYGGAAGWFSYAGVPVTVLDAWRATIIA